MDDIPSRKDQADFKCGCFRAARTCNLFRYTLSNLASPDIITAMLPHVYFREGTQNTWKT